MARILFEELKKIYPDLLLQQHPSDSDQTLSIPYQKKWVLVNAADKTKNELSLIQLVLSQQKDTIDYSISNSIWKQFLLKESKELPVSSGSYRLIHFFFYLFDESFNSNLWKEAIINLFSPIEDVFFLNSDEAIAVQSDINNLPLNEIQGMLQTLDDDFSTRTFAYIGHFFSINEYVPDLYLEEQVIFSNERSQSSQTVLSLATVALSYYTSFPKSKSVLMFHLKEQIAQDATWKELILTLWNTQGNISLAAKQLFIHRNTLQYRMDRYFEATALSLRDINDLTLSYLAII